MLLAPPASLRGCASSPPPTRCHPPTSIRALQLKELVEYVAEDWSEEAQYCLKEYRREKGGPK